LNRQKTLLFSIIAHDLRNPFQAVLGLSSILSQAVAAKDHPSIERRAQGVRGAAGQAYALMEGLFAWASLQMDTTSVTFDSVDIAEVAREAIEGGAEAAADKGLTLTNDCESLRVRAQRDMLSAILRNLVSNALKFTLPGGKVAVSARPLGDVIAIAVTDTGVGMPPNKIADLFQLDRRTTTLGTAGERGSGLGLLLCRELVERLGSELTVSSAIDRGTTFSFALASDDEFVSASAASS
jgi:two-component system sensor histidine kinase/response regulator